MSTTGKTLSLTEREVQQFHENGFLLKKGLVAPDMMRQIDAQTAALHEQMAASTPPEVHVSWEKPIEGRPPRIRQLMHSEVVSPGLNTVLRSDDVLDIVEALIGPDISLFHSKLLMKAARDGTVTPWHQDYAYWKREGNNPVQINCMLAIDPAARANGCIQFVPGSHKGGLLSHDRRNEAFGVFLPGYFNKRDDAVFVEMQPGDCCFFNSLVIHGSDGNSSPNSRRANTVAYTVTGDDPRQCREVLRGKAL